MAKVSFSISIDEQLDLRIATLLLKIRRDRGQKIKRKPFCERAVEIVVNMLEKEDLRYEDL